VVFGSAQQIAMPPAAPRAYWKSAHRQSGADLAIISRLQLSAMKG